MSCSIVQCRLHGCDKIKRVPIQTSNGTRMSVYCSITDKVPGNMSKCPLGVY